MDTAARTAPALLPNVLGVQYSRDAQYSSLPTPMELGTPKSRQPPAFQPAPAPAEPARHFLPHACQRSPAWTGAAAQTWHCLRAAPPDEQFAAGVRATVRTRGYLVSGARLAAAAAQSHPQSAVFQLSSCPGPELAGLRAPARQAAQR